LHSTVAAGHALPQSIPWKDLEARANFISRSQLLELSVQLALRVPGNVVEFGVATGSSTRVIKRTLEASSRLNPYRKKTIFALDSFEGLPEQFENAPVGAFAGPVPKIEGVVFVKGYFEQTCTEDLRQRVGRVAFAHLDADLFSSTLCALRWLTPLLNTGSILQFDEFIGGDCAESRAFDEWRAESGLQLIRIAEVDRDPSGWGNIIDRRLVFQVIGDEPLPPRFEHDLSSATLHRVRRVIGDSTYLRLKEMKKRVLG
jgi:Macrocin-O-methyltransferase (TylF)